MPNRIYTTDQGDMPDQIAYEVYGREGYMAELLQANPEHIGTPEFDAGVALQLPDIEPPPQAGLPPWKRGTRE